MKDIKRKIFNAYGKKISKEDAETIYKDRDQRVELNRVINMYERLAVGVNLNVYDINTLNRLVGRRLIQNYSRFENYISLRRQGREREAWINFEVLRDNLIRMRNKRHVRINRQNKSSR